MISWRTISSAWKRQQVMAEHCGLPFYLLTEVSVCVFKLNLYKTESIMVCEFISFEKALVLNLSMWGNLLVSECCVTLHNAVNEAYFALFSMGGVQGGL